MLSYIWLNPLLSQPLHAMRGAGSLTIWIGSRRWRLGACFRWTGSGGHFKGYTRRLVGFLQRLEFCGLGARVTENKTFCLCKVHGATQNCRTRTKTRSHKAQSLSAFVASCESLHAALDKRARENRSLAPSLTNFGAQRRLKTYSPASRATSRQPISRRQKPLSKSIWSTAA